MLKKLLFLSIILVSCKTTHGNHSRSSAEVGTREATPAERELIANIIRSHYSVAIPGAEDKFPALVVSDEILNEFTNTLFNSENQTSRELFLDLVAQSTPPSNELLTYVVQEFSVMTNLFQKTLARLGAGVDLPLTFIGGQ